MKNYKNILATAIVGGSLWLGSLALTESKAQWVNWVLCNKSGTTEIKKWKITIYNDSICYISEGNSQFFEQLAKIKKEQKLDEMVVYPFHTKPSWNNNMIIKIDWSQNDTWWSDFYLYDAKKGTLRNLNANTLDDAVQKVESKV